MSDCETMHRSELLQEWRELSAIFDLSGLSLVIVESNNTISRVNAEFVALSGYSREELEGKRKWTELCTAEEGGETGSEQLISETDPTPKNGEVRLIRKNGGSLVTYLTVNPLPESEKYLISLIDITEHRQAGETSLKSPQELEARVRERTLELEQLNKALREEIEERKRAEQSVVAERQRFNHALELLPAYLVLLTPDYHVPFANRFFRERFGESHGRRCFEYLFERSEPCEICETYGVLQSMSPHEWEWNGPDGHSYHIFDLPFTDADGSTLIMEMGIDITEQKQSKEALQKTRDLLEAKVAERTAALHAELTQRQQVEEAYREANDYLENLINYANAPIIVWDPDYKITRFNRAFERLTGYSAGEVVGQSLEILFPDSQKEESMNLIHRTACGERWEVVEIAIAHRDGAVRTVLWNSATLYAADGTTVVATIAQGQDITERKRAEKELLTSHQELESMVRERTAELEKVNEALREEIEERKRAEEIISRQAQEILEVSTPVIQIWDRIVSVPLIGTLDSRRTQQLMEQLLHKIVETASSIALLDVTGVPTIDSKTARYLIETISAVHLLGAEVVLTGIRPEIARTLVQLGVDLSNVNTRSSFSAGLLFALNLLKMQVVKQS